MRLDLVGAGVRIVIPSVDYADYLAVTLPAWQAMFPGAAITIVTAPGDTATQALAIHYGARVVVTSAWYAGGKTFDKASALDEGFGFKRSAVSAPSKGERCIAADADVLPFGFLPQERLKVNTVYGCARYLCSSMDELEAHRRGKTKRSTLPVMLARYRGMSAPPVLVDADKASTLKSAKACLGYFQLFRYYPGQTFGSFKTAGKYDLVFRDSFAHKVALWDFYVLHLGEPCRANWRGRVVPAWDRSNASDAP